MTPAAAAEDDKSLTITQTTGPCAVAQENDVVCTAQVKITTGFKNADGTTVSHEVALTPEGVSIRFCYS